MNSWIIIAALIAVTFVTAIFIGNYFTNFALARSGKKSGSHQAASGAGGGDVGGLRKADPLKGELPSFMDGDDPAAVNHVQAMLCAAAWKRAHPPEKVSIVSEDGLRLAADYYAASAPGATAAALASAASAVATSAASATGSAVAASAPEGGFFGDGAGTVIGAAANAPAGAADGIVAAVAGRAVDSEEPRASVHRWVILLHGYKGRKEEMEPFAMEYHRRGWHVLCPDLRSHGESQGKFIGMGYLDGRDLLGWIGYAAHRDPQAEVAVHGHSMGGASVVTACGSHPPENLKAAVADCPFSSAPAMFKKQLREWFRLPSFPVYYFARIVFLLRGGYNLSRAEAIGFAPKCRTPILYIHGDQDRFVPPEMSRQLYRVTPSETELVIVPGAAHVQSQDADPAGYYGAVFAFLERFL